MGKDSGLHCSRDQRPKRSLMAFLASLLLKTQGRVVGFASYLDESNEPFLAFDGLLFQQRVKSKLALFTRSHIDS